jgi:hypothetical protein
LLLTLGVLLAHGIALDWLTRNTPGPGALSLMAEPDFRVVKAVQLGDTPAANAPPADVPPPLPSAVGQTLQARTLAAHHPAKPATEPPRPAPAAAPAPRPTPRPSALPPPPETPPPEATLPLSGPTQDVHQITDAQPSKNSESFEASALSNRDVHAPVSDTAPAPSSAWLATWPVSTRLNYSLQGYYRGDFSGRARVQWQRADERYQAQVDVNVALLFQLSMTSQGRITPQRLWPEAYEENRRGQKRGVRLGDQLLHLQDGRTLPRPSQLQDAASQFIQISRDFAQKHLPLQVGTAVPVTLARPGGVDEWVYDVVSLDTLNTGLGEVQAYHLQPRPLAQARGPISVEMWYAPTLQHLPVRIRLTLNPETWLDLRLEGIEQSTAQAL